MKNTIKTLVIMGALLQGTATFAADIVSANINSGGAFEYSVKVANGVQAQCSSLTLAEKAPGHIKCDFIKDTLSQQPKVLFTVTKMVKGQKFQDCDVNGSLSDKNALQLTAAGFCIDGAVLNSTNTVGLQ